MKIKINESQLKNLIKLNITEDETIDTVGLINKIISSADNKNKSNSSNSTGPIIDKVQTSGASSLSPRQLFEKLKKYSDDTNMCAAIVANAAGESGSISHNCAAKGDSKIAPNYPTKQIDGYCSFGLFQFNVCGGLGIEYLKSHGLNEKSEKTKKMYYLTNCDEQIKFMVNHIKNNSKKPINGTGVNKWIEWIVLNVERPANKPAAIKNRQKWAQNNLNIFNDGYFDVATL